ncbi:unnamed protein product [Aphanomyces euteiches]|uniref:Uncharacterized protein n=1 Tax=Aphanomyces euteiches TaxID=100861 RepID=A0A6G0W614_9STRA|nr:hypothetical protein Ae201684_018364 [Aphanomyces euteiches]KAH9097591.1 hypothetical protein Ae201684P_001067 [Aphanomyces euteiches]KAH9139995.1 hypothetical protein AeRB84_015720 [Aphanomyces euteiches]
MHSTLATDLDAIPELTASAQALAVSFLGDIDSHPAARTPCKVPDETPQPHGVGAAVALERFRTKWLPHLSGSAGPRYLGFVVGGATPASLIGDWLTSAVDQNPTSNWDSEAPNLERETVRALSDWFGLSSHTGTFVSGATMSNFVGLAIGREWIGRQRGVSISEDGLAAAGRIQILGAKPHSSIYKAVSMLGLGRSSVTLMPSLPGREAIDVAALEAALAATGECIVTASLGTVNSGDFDDLVAIAALKSKYSFWLHVDGAFGAFAALDPRLADKVAGLDAADSVCIDLHKWMNVPYDSALQFTRHQDLQVAVFQNAAAYLGDIGENPNSVHLTPENSRRWRALATWFAVQAYGKEGHADIVTRNVNSARKLSGLLAADSRFEVLAPVHLNIVVFAVIGTEDEASMHALLARVTAAGEIFLTPTVFDGKWAIRAAFSNWRTEVSEVERIFQALASVL